MEYRQATLGDIPDVSKLFLDAFAPSVQHFTGKDIPNHHCINDIFKFVFVAEPDSFFVAVDESEVIGYLIACRNMKAIWRKALLQCTVFSWAYSCFTGRYGVSAKAITSIIRHKLLFITSRQNYRSTSQGQILSISVHADYRNQGIAQQLLKLGLEYLKPISEVKLEVRPENKYAISLYKSQGFFIVDKVTDSQGPWLVMVKRLQ